MAKKQRKLNKGFRRTAKEWEKSIAGHIGKAIDSGHMADYLLYAGLAYLGYEHFGDIKGAIWGPVCLKLAMSPNIVAGTSGILGLVTLGVCVSGVEIDLPDFTSWEAFQKKEKERAKKSKIFVPLG